MIPISPNLAFVAETIHAAPKGVVLVVANKITRQPGIINYLRTVANYGNAVDEFLSSFLLIFSLACLEIFNQRGCAVAFSHTLNSVQVNTANDDMMSSKPQYLSRLLSALIVTPIAAAETMPKSCKKSLAISPSYLISLANRRRMKKPHGVR